MNFVDYQKACAKTDLGNVGGRKVLKPEWMYYVLGIGGEAGEFQEKVKKLFRDYEGVVSDDFRDDIIKELGDILWYMARLCDHLDIPFEDVPKMNVVKLMSRKKRDMLHGDGDNR